MTNKEKCFKYLTETAALSRAVAIGIMANIRHESNFNPTAKGDSGTSYGLCQWHKSRWDRLKTYCADNGLSSSNLEAQLRFMVYEFKKFYSKHWQTMLDQENTVDGAAEVAYIMCVKYEIPANKEQSGKNRGKTARSLWTELYTLEGGDVEKSPEISTGVQQTGAKVRKARYTIQRGDTLTKIAWSFNVSIGDILSYNPAITNPDLIIEGDKIIIPGRAG